MQNRNIDSLIHSLLENSFDFIMVIDKEYRIKLINSKLKNQLEHDLEKSVNIGDQFPSLLSSERNQFWVSKFEDSFKGNNLCFEQIFNYSDIKIYGEVHINPILTDNIVSEIIVIIKDLSEKKEIESVLHESVVNYTNIFNDSQEKYMNIFRNIQDIYYETDHEGHILEISPSVFKVLGYHREELIGKNSLMLYRHPEIRPMLLDILKNQNHVDNFELELTNKSGKSVYLSANIVLENDKSSKFPKIIGSMRDITSFRIAEEEKNILLKAIEQNPVSVVITDPQGKIIYVNPTFTELTGYSFTEALHENLSVLKSGEQSPAFYKNLWETITSGKTWKGEILNKRKDNSLFWESAIISPIKDSEGNITHFLAIKEDITYIKKIQNRLELSENHYKKMFLEAPNPFHSLDLSGKILEVNAAWQKLTGFSSEKVVGTNFNVYLTPDSANVLEFYRPLLMEQGSLKDIEIEMVNAEQLVLTLNINMNNQVNEDGQFIKTQCILTDISERKLFEIKLKEAKTKAEESDRLKTAFLANMSHEIRTPMNAILGFSNLLDDENLEKQEMKDYIQIINRRGNDLLQIISDIIDISRIEAGDIRFLNEEIPVNAFLKELFKDFKEIIQLKEKNNLQFKKILQALPDDAVVFADKVRFRQIWENLIQNAIKFTEFGFIEIGYHVNNNLIEFFVKDTGIGIEDNKQQIIFERFRQANDTHTRDFGGTGLGLAISKYLINLMGGTIWLESVFGSGSTFYFSLPFRLSSEQKVIHQPPLNLIKEIGRLDLKKKIVLVVEDEPSNYYFLESVLRKMNATIIWAKDGYSAIEYTRTHKEISIVLMDIRMPGINGYTATREIRAFNKELPIIAQTAYALQDDRKKAIEAGCNDFITKPINLVDLKKILMKFF